jgi:hypoxanthine-DNA glycosylase
MLTHPFPPLFSEESNTLILGSFPSVKSREAMFFYGHPQNRFWKVIASLYGAPVPASIPEKRELILQNRLALWDSIASCEITGSSDSSIKNAAPTDLGLILRSSKVDRIFCNGTASFNIYCKYQLPLLGIEAVKLPSTSPANAAWSLEKLITAWQAILR